MTPFCLRCSSSLDGTGVCVKCAAEGRALGMALLGVPIGGRYTVLARLRIGPGSVVWSARDAESGAEVVVKQLAGSPSGFDEAAERLRREARALLRIDHPAIVRLIDLVEHQGVPCLVLSNEYGLTLRRMLSNRVPIPWCEALAAVAELADGLECAHRAGVVHRDVKPDNIVFVDDGQRKRPKLLDFGIAAIERSVSITGEGDLLGTPGYLAPEYVLDGHSDACTDVYSLGVTLYEMISLELPHSAKTTVERMRRQATEAPTPLRVHVPHLPEDVDDVVGRAIARLRDERYKTMASFRDALREVSARRCV